jgi:hypothetical protein
MTTSVNYTSSSSFGGQTFQNASYGGSTFVTTQPYVQCESSTGKGRKHLQNIGQSVNNIVNSIGSAVDNAARKLEDKFTSDSKLRWASFEIQEPLLGEYRCKALNVNHGLRGYCFISTNYFCFSSHLNDSNQNIRVVIPLKAIVGIQQVKKISKKKELPRFRPVSEISLTPDTIQVFTNENIVHHFYCFQPNYEQAWNILNHSWRAAQSTEINISATPRIYISNVPSTS